MLRSTTRWLIGLGLLLAMLLGPLTACRRAPTPVPLNLNWKGGAPQTGTPPAVATITPPPDMASEQTLRYLTQGFDPLEPATEGAFERSLIAHVWMPFFRHDSKGNLVPWLASRYEVNKDQSIYTVHIDPRAVWSDGTPVMAKEAKDYWIYALTPNACQSCWLLDRAAFMAIQGAAELADGKASDLTGVVLKDDRTLEIRLVRPDPLFIHRLALFNSGFAKVEDAKKGATYAIDGSGRVNGPFQVALDVATMNFELRVNPKWWGAKPLLNRIVVQSTGDLQAGLTRWQAGELDVAYWPGGTGEQLRRQQGGTFTTLPSPANLFYSLRPDRAPLDDINVRRALIHAVDWSRVMAPVDDTPRNDAVRETVLSPELPCYRTGNYPEWGYNVSRAREELAKSKYGSAEKLGRIRVAARSNAPIFLRTAERIVEMWRQNLGLTDVEIRPDSPDAWKQDRDKVQVDLIGLAPMLPDAGTIVADYRFFAWGGQRLALQEDDLGRQLSDLATMNRSDARYCDAVQKAEAALLGSYTLVPMTWQLAEYGVRPWVKGLGAGSGTDWYSFLEVYIARH